MVYTLLVYRERCVKSRQNPRVDFFYGKKRLRRIQNGVFPFTVVEFCARWICLQLPFIRPEEAVSWTQRFLTRNVWPKNEVYLWQTNLKANICRNSTFQVNTRKNATLKTTSYLEEPNRHFCQHFMRRTTQQTFSAINLASQQKTTRLFFSSQVRKQFKLIAVPLKSLRCCLRSDYKLVNCLAWNSSDCFESFSPLNNVWIDRPLIPSSDVTHYPKTG